MNLLHANIVLKNYLQWTRFSPFTKPNNAFSKKHVLQYQHRKMLRVTLYMIIMTENWPKYLTSKTVTTQANITISSCINI